MRIAIDVSPLESGHKVRGVGFYVRYLRDALLKYFPEHDYTFFTSEKQIPSRVDIVHYPYFDPFQITLPFRKKFPLVVTVHDLTPIIFPSHFPAGIQGTLKWFIQRQRLSMVDGVITDSVASKKDILTHIRIPEEKVSVAYLASGEGFQPFPIRDSHLKILRSKYHLPEKFVLYVGDGTWNKNVPCLVDACTRLQIPLVLVGKVWTQDFDHHNAWNRDLLRVETLAHDNPYLIRLGFVENDELVMLYTMATLFVFPSVYEGFGLPPLEAMSCGCPVIMTRESCMVEVGGEAAFYVEDAFDSRSFAKAIQTVWDDPLLRKRLIRKGFDNVKRFSWKKCAGETLEAYQRALK